MKKLLCSLLAAGLIISALGACSANGGNSSREPTSAEGSVPAPSVGSGAQSSPAPLPGGEDIQPEDDRLVVMDAPMYRGVVTSVSQENGIWEMRLEQYPGTAFGYPTMTMHTDEHTDSRFELSEMKQGDYLEVYFGDRADGLPSVAIAINKLPAAEDCVFNGELKQWNQTEGGGTLEMQSLDGKETIRFACDDGTNFYLNRDDLKPGDKLNVFHRGTLTKSAVPQGYALEVRPYSES